jgi:predicted transcriptional regulator
MKEKGKPARKKQGQSLNLEKVILELVGKMQPISSEELWLEIGENAGLEQGPSQAEVHQLLEKMAKKKILGKVKLHNKEARYTIVGK